MGKYIGIRLAHALVILTIVIVLVFLSSKITFFPKERITNTMYIWFPKRKKRIVVCFL